ncbi:transcription factor HES-5-like [Sander vitreus]
MAPSTTRDCPDSTLSLRDCPISTLSLRDCPDSTLSLRDCTVSTLSSRGCPDSTLSSRDCPVSTLSSRVRHKLRKPAVEKLRRDRINSCIKQLKVMLEKEFHKQDPNAKLEKADVLEMTVAFLKQQLQPPSPANHTARSHDSSHCWKETLHFLSTSSLQEATPPRQTPRCLHTSRRNPTLLAHRRVQAAGKQPAVWRPW